MSFLKPDPPEPVNPYVAASAQTGTNVSTAVANAMLNRVNQVTPQGSLTYNTTGNYSWTDPSTGHSYNIPQQTVSQILSPTQQAIQGQQEATQYNLAGMANAQSQRIAGLLSNEIDISGAPARGNAELLQTGSIPAARATFEGGGPIQNSLQGTWDVTRDYGPADNFSADRSRVEQALYDRLNPQLQQERSNIEQRLSDQGIRYGSAAYTRAMDDYNRMANDARLAVTAQGGAEQQRLNQMEAQRAAFQNTAQAQGYEQALGAGGFANQAQAQQFGQNAQQAQFYNTALAQQLAQQQSAFNAAQASRNAWLNEQYAQRNQPIQEISALMSGSQVQNPNFVNTPSTQIPTTDVAGLMNQNFNQQQSNYQTASQNWQSLMGGILGMGAAYLRSDRRSKTNVERVGTVFAFNEDAERSKLPIYEYEYKRGDGVRHTGPMAQDVEKIDSDAVLQDRQGVKYIDARRVLGNILKAA